VTKEIALLKKTKKEITFYINALIVSQVENNHLNNSGVLLSG